MRKSAVVLLSGGLDSSTVLYHALSKGYRCRALVFDYGQRHRRELGSARRIAAACGVPCRTVRFGLPWKGSSLVDRKSDIPCGRAGKGIPSTYVPARNIIFLAFAVSYAEAAGASSVFIGANAVDYSGYPDCRPGFIRAFDRAAKLGTKCGAAGRRISIKAPLVSKSKAGIVRAAVKLDVPLELTWSCYRGGKRPCMKCDSCRLRKKGFTDAGVKDPLKK